MPPPEQAAPAAETSWEQKAWSIGKNVAMFVALQFALKQFMGGSTPATTTPSPDAVGTPSPVGGQNAKPLMSVPYWSSNVSVDVAMYISPSVVMPAFDRMSSQYLIVDEKNFSLASALKDNRGISKEFQVPPTVQRNGTLWAHIFVAQTGEELDPSSPKYDSAKAYRMIRPLTQYLGKKKVRKTRNLLEAKNESKVIEEEPEETGPLIASYYHPNISLDFIPETGPTDPKTMHPAMRQYYTFESTGKKDASGKNGYYYPPLYLNTFWQLKSHMTELNSTLPVDRLPINIQLKTLPNWQFSLMAAMDEGMKETARKAALGQTTPGGGDGSEMELIKETLLDTNPWLLGTTAFVSVLHMIFELLAFKSDVGHWRKKKDNVGVSFRTILSNVVMQLIIFLYLLDNNESTSWMILFGQGMGIAIEAWKVTKTVNVRVRAPQPGSWAHGLLPYLVVFEDKHVKSETEEKTEEYDKIAFKYMGIVAVPLLLAYAGYSLKYDTHKSWYSFIIATLVGSVYAYGFLMMVPALYINYRLKSVAHMPGRAMAYKFLNTFIDDLFAFTIKMPLLHRLATLRDDVIFFVYLYQAWAYKVDHTRVNEFGQGGDDEETEAKTATKPLTAPASADGKVAVEEIKDLSDKVDGVMGATGREKSGGRKRKG